MALQLLNVIGVAVEQQIFRSLLAGILHDRHQVLRPVVVLGVLVAMEEIAELSIAGDHGAVLDALVAQSRNEAGVLEDNSIQPVGSLLLQVTCREHQEFLDFWHSRSPLSRI